MLKESQKPLGAKVKEAFKQVYLGFLSLPKGFLSQTVCCRLRWVGVSIKIGHVEGLNI